MTLAELESLSETIWDISVNPDPKQLALAVQDLRAALLKVVHHLETEQSPDTE